MIFKYEIKLHFILITKILYTFNNYFLKLTQIFNIYAKLLDKSIYF